MNLVIFIFMVSLFLNRIIGKMKRKENNRKPRGYTDGKDENK